MREGCAGMAFAKCMPLGIRRVAGLPWALTDEPLVQSAAIVARLAGRTHHHWCGRRIPALAPEGLIVC
jgi:hypothetical protein